MRELIETDLALEAAQSPDLLAAREQVIGKLLMEYSDILREGRYDMAFNRLSKYLYNLRSIQFEIESEEPDYGRE